jgi:hypothetical protein
VRISGYRFQYFLSAVQKIRHLTHKGQFAIVVVWKKKIVSSCDNFLGFAPPPPKKKYIKTGNGKNSELFLRF